MSMSQIAVLTRDQHDMLKTFLPAFKIARSGSVEEREFFWESIYSQWFATWPERAVHFGEIPHDQVLSDLQETSLIEAIRRRCRMAGKKWATPEQEEFLLSFMSEFCESAAAKNYDDFFMRIWALWFERWSEEHVIFKDMPDDYVRTLLQTGVASPATVKRHRQSAGKLLQCPKEDKVKVQGTRSKYDQGFNLKDESKRYPRE
ncbi:hypothetical protein BDR07DRAFT_1481587 [Suillus spraguei]|nr:hypothetical protein BDR07DRAFT_1481587 [Suillus spraguei]